MGALLSREDKITALCAHLVCGLFSFCAVMPFVLLIIASFTDNNWALNYGFSYAPQKWSFEAYDYVLEHWETIGRAYAMSLLVTAIGTAANLFISTQFAYGISKRDIPGMRMVSFLLIFTMLFNGGLVSTYYSYIRIWHIKDTIWALIVPNLMMNAFYVILFRNYFTNSIPPSLEEAARIDGASEYSIFLRIMLPLSKPIIASVGLMSGLAYWNDWVNGLYYLSNRGGAQYYTLQIVLNNINEDIKALMQSASDMANMSLSIASIPSTTIRMAIAVIGIIPILILYPFFQRFFIRGITLGGVKE